MIEDTTTTGPLALEPIEEIEFRVAEAVADIEEARRQGRASPLEDWVRRYPEAADHIREAVAACSLVDSALETAGLRLSVASEGDDATFTQPDLEDFEILRVMTSGAMGVVYEAVQKSTHRKVALKTLPAGLLPNVRRRRLFEREVEAVAALHHPNIVPIFSSGLAKGQYYFAMQFIEGKHLDDYVQSITLRSKEGAAAAKRGERIPVRDILTLMAKVCDAVYHAHQRGVIHRDLKPSNILVDKKGEPHLVDFGLAKTFAFDTQEAVESAFTLGGQVFGTLPYLAPEQARGESDEIDVRTDVYALGVVLYKLLTESYPYPVKASLRDVLDHIQNTVPQQPAKALIERGLESGQAYRAINDELEAILMAALAKKKEDRYQSAADFADDLRRFLAGEPIEAKHHARWRYMLRKFVERNAFPITLIVLVVILAMALAWRMHVDAENLSPYQVEETLQREMEQWKLDRVAQDEQAWADLQQTLAVRNLVVTLRLGFDHWRHGETDLIAEELMWVRDYYESSSEEHPIGLSFFGALDQAFDQVVESISDPDRLAVLDEFQSWCDTRLRREDPPGRER